MDCKRLIKLKVFKNKKNGQFTLHPSKKELGKEFLKEWGDKDEWSVYI